MNPFAVSVLVFAGLCSSLPVFAQAAAGRLIASVGEVTIMRGGSKLAGLSGTAVLAGDTVQLGPQSNAQILFTDSSIVALRPDTDFSIREYGFASDRPEAGRAFFSLLKGGMRTVTGLIGRRNQSSYAVNTPVATIGIRGTHYGLVHSDTSFTNADGTVAPSGTYGSVTDGRIGVTNASGAHDFGADQYFHVAATDTAPRQLIAPPSFLSDKLEGRSRAGTTQAASAPQGQSPAENQQQSPASVAPTSASGGTGDSRVSSSTALTTVPNTFNTNVFQVNTQATSSTSGLNNTVQPTFSGTIFYYLAGPVNIPTSCGNPPCSAAVIGEFTVGINLALQRATASAAFKLSSGEIFNLNIPINISGVPIAINGNQISFSGTFDRADFPNNSGSFSCSQCGPGGTQGFADQLTVSGTVTGSQATVTFSGTNLNVGGGGTGSITANLTQQAPPNGSAAAIATPVQGGGTDTRSASYFNVQLDSAGRLLQFGPLVGEVRASVGGATSTIVGADPSAGNLVWGTWTNGSSAATKATITDNNYATFQPGNNTIQPWITGDASNSLPPSLGTLTFTPIGTAFSSANQRLNSASLTADFVNRSLSLNINATNMTAGNTFQMNGTTGFSPTSSRFSSAFSSVTCSGPCVGGTPTGSYGGFFSGNQAQGAGVVYSGGFGAGTGVTGAIAFKR